MSASPVIDAGGLLPMEYKAWLNALASALSLTIDNSLNPYRVR